MKKETMLKITGMSCTSCAKRVKSILLNDVNIEDAEVNFVGKRATIKHGEDFDSTQVIHVLEKAGYHASLLKEINVKKFIVNGMSCTSCANNVEKLAEKSPGVTFSKVNFADKKLIIEVDETDFDVDSLVKTIHNAGYELGIEDRQEEKEIDHLKAEFNRLIFSWVITLPLTIKMIFEMVWNKILINHEVAFVIDLVFSFIVIFIIGNSVIRATLFSVKKFSFNMDSLIGIGTMAAFSSGILKLTGFNIENFMVVGAMIMSINFIGNYLKEKATGRASQAIKQLLELGAKSAHKIIENGEIIEVPIESLNVYDIVLIKPGEKIPIDGVIIEGKTAIDESIATGESFPVDKSIGDKVIGATINLFGAIKIKIEKVGKDTFLSQIIKMVEEAQSSKIPIQAFADKVTQIFVPIILGLTAFAFIFWLFFPEIGKNFISPLEPFIPWVNLDRSVLSMALFASIATLVIACPCALGLATPTALMVGMGKGAMNGILIKNGEAIQIAQNIDTVVFDKTGTITNGKPSLESFISLINDHDFLQLVGSIENLSEHPLAKAIVNSVKEKGIEVKNLTDIKSVTGKGIEAEYFGDTIKIGSKRFFEGFNIHDSGFTSFVEDYESKGYTLVFVSKNDLMIGALCIFDEIKSDSKKAIEKLHNIGIKTVMLTGDNKNSAKSIAEKVCIDKFFAELLPEDKISIIRDLQTEGKLVAMVGDGINDAPALKQADIGIAIGTGTDIAIESSDITLVSGSLIGVAKAIDLSKKTYRKILQNLFWAFFYNVLAIPLALMGLLHPAVAEMAMAFSSINVVSNSLRLRKVRLGE